MDNSDISGLLLLIGFGFIITGLILSSCKNMTYKNPEIRFKKWEDDE